MRLILKLLKVLNSESDPIQISLAFGFAMIAGLTPLFSLHNAMVLLLVLLLRVNLSAFIIGLVFFSGIAYLLDPLFHWFGLLILTSGSLEGLWTVLYNSTIWRLENFNNSIVMGSLLFAILFFAPFSFALNKLIIKYRENIITWVQRLRIVQVLKASRFYNLYQSVS